MTAHSLAISSQWTRPKLHFHSQHRRIPLHRRAHRQSHVTALNRPKFES
jgi:hypothetical protein